MSDSDSGCDQDLQHVVCDRREVTISGSTKARSQVAEVSNQKRAKHLLCYSIFTSQQNSDGGIQSYSHRRKRPQWTPQSSTYTHCLIDSLWLNTVTVASPHTSSKTNLTAVQTQLALPASGWTYNKLHFTIIKRANVKVLKKLLTITSKLSSFLTPSA